MVALEAILASEKFVAAPQMSAFLRYVVEQAASGNKFRIKAYTVAVDALGKPDTFDPQNDPVVRVLAGRLRSSLSAYYEQRPQEDVVIEMKPGSYVPVFLMKNEKDSDDEASETQALTEDDMDHSATAANSIICDTDVAADSTANNDVAPAEDNPAIREGGSASQSAASGTADTATEHGAAVPSRSALVSLAQRFPKLSMAAALLLAFLVGTLVNDTDTPDEPQMQAASLAQSSASGDVSPLRERPDLLSLFVSTMEPTDTLVSQLSTMMIGVFSEAEDLRVYRIMRSTQRQQFWPEDYLLSINVLPLPDETRISVQLVEAQTGRISHVENLHLSTSAAQQLSAEELKTVIDCANYLISIDGPLRSDYQTKTDS